MGYLQRVLIAWTVCLFIATPVRVLGSGDSWEKRDAGFKVLDITHGSGEELWTCGSDASIAVSTDGGVHWEVRDQSKDGGLFLSIEFRNSFGYAVGTTGFVAFTHDGGKTWVHATIPYKDVLSASFSDSNHGLVRTRSGVFVTSDGKTWSSINDKYSSELAKYPYVLSVAALDERHLAVHISEAPPSGSGFLYSKDSGATWALAQIPSTTITTLLDEENKYWAVGTEVIHKEQRGGYAVPLLLYSTDGEHWEHSKHDIQMCHWEGCGGRCTKQGCLAASSLVLRVFDEDVQRIVFPANPNLTLKWALAANAICFVGEGLECATTKIDPKADAEKMEGSTPSLNAQPLVKTDASKTIQCIRCGLESVYVDAKANGRYSLGATLLIDKNGLVREVEIEKPPSPTLEANIRRSMLQWVFLPVQKDGVAVNVKLNTKVNVLAVRPK